MRVSVGELAMSMGAEGVAAATVAADADGVVCALAMDKASARPQAANVLMIMMVLGMGPTRES